MKHKPLHPVVSLMLLIAVFPLIAAPSTGGRPYSTKANPVLELEGAVAGYLLSAEGGYPYAEVVPEKIGPDRIQKKHLGMIRYEDITLSFGLNMSGEVYAWIRETLSGNGSRKNGAVIMADYQGQIVKRIDFYNARITEIIFSPFDASSKSTGMIKLKLSCDFSRESQPGGSIARAAGTKQKAWTQNNFRLKIDGLEAALTRVTRIESLTIRQMISKDMNGNPRFPTETTYVDALNLSVVLPEEDAAPLKQWMGTVAEKNGSIEVLSANMQETLFTLNLSNIGLIRLAPEPTTRGADVQLNIKADMFLEKVDFNITSEDDEPATPSRRSS